MGPDKAASRSAGTKKGFLIIVLFPVVKEVFLSFTELKVPTPPHHNMDLFHGDFLKLHEESSSE